MSNRWYRYENPMYTAQGCQFKCRKCGHSLTITSPSNKKTCSWCGTLNFKDPKDLFQYQFKLAQRKLSQQK